MDLFAQSPQRQNVSLSPGAILSLEVRHTLNAVLSAAAAVFFSSKQSSKFFFFSNNIIKASEPQMEQFTLQLSEDLVRAWNHFWRFPYDAICPQPLSLTALSSGSWVVKCVSPALVQNRLRVNGWRRICACLFSALLIQLITHVFSFMSSSLGWARCMERRKSSKQKPLQCEVDVKAASAPQCGAQCMAPVQSSCSEAAVHLNQSELLRLPVFDIPTDQSGLMSWYKVPVGCWVSSGRNRHLMSSTARLSLARNHVRIIRLTVGTAPNSISKCAPVWHGVKKVQFIFQKCLCLSFITQLWNCSINPCCPFPRGEVKIFSFSFVLLNQQRRRVVQKQECSLRGGDKEPISSYRRTGVHVELEQQQFKKTWTRSIQTFIQSFYSG